MILLKLKTLLSWFKKRCSGARNTKDREISKEHPALESGVAKIEGILEAMMTGLNHFEDGMGRLEGRL